MSVTVTLTFPNFEAAKAFFDGRKESAAPAAAAPSAPPPEGAGRPVVAEPPKRGRGRPRKSEQAAADVATEPRDSGEPAVAAPSIDGSAAGNGPTLDDVRAALTALNEAKGIAVVQQVMREFNAARVSSLEAKDYEGVIKRCEELKAA